MLDEKQREHVGNVTTTLQIITAALASGVLMFAGVVLVLFQDSNQSDQEISPMITYVAVAFGGMALVGSVIVPRLMDATSRKKLLTSEDVISDYPMQTAEVGEVGLFAGMYQMRLIIGVALLEGAAFLNIAANMIEGQTMSLVIAALLLVAIILNFPTRGRVADWIEAERKTVEELRNLQGQQLIYQ